MWHKMVILFSQAIDSFENSIRHHIEIEAGMKGGNALPNQ